MGSSALASTARWWDNVLSAVMPITSKITFENKQKKENKVSERKLDISFIF